MKTFHFAPLLLAAFLFAPTLPAPVRMRTRHDNLTRQRRDAPPLSIACAVQNLKEALSHVEIEYNFQGFSCSTLTHVNIQMLLGKLEALVEYAATENIFTNLTTSVPAYTLMQVVNSTISSIVPHVGNATEVESYVPQSGTSGVECTGEFCSDNCGLCRAGCELHRLRTGVGDLIGLLEADFVSQCQTCVSAPVQAETVQMRDLLQSIGDQLIPSTSFYCAPLVLMHLPECGQPLELLERAEILTSAMNDSLSPLHGSQSLSNIQLVVERLSDSVLPHTRLSLESQEERGCPALSELSTGPECETVSPSQIAGEVEALLPASGCGEESGLVVGLRTLNLLRYNYSQLVLRLHFLGLL